MARVPRRIASGGRATAVAPVTLAPGQSVTLRYAYGAAHAAAIPAIVATARNANRIRVVIVFL